MLALHFEEKFTLILSCQGIETLSLIQEGAVQFISEPVLHFRERKEKKEGKTT